MRTLNPMTDTRNEHTRELLGFATLDSDRPLLERGDELAIYRDASGKLVAASPHEIDEDAHRTSFEDVIAEARAAAHDAGDLASAKVAIEKLLQAVSVLEYRQPALDSDRMRTAIAHARGNGPDGSGSRLTKNGKDIAELGARRAFAYYFKEPRDRTTVPLGRFGHHSDPIEDFLIEVDALTYALDTATGKERRALDGRFDVARTCTLPPTPRVIEGRRRLEALLNQPA